MLDKWEAANPNNNLPWTNKAYLNAKWFAALKMMDKMALEYADFVKKSVPKSMNWHPHMQKYKFADLKQAWI